MPDPKAVPRRLSGGDESSLDPLARLLLDAVDGKLSVADLGECCGVGADLAARMAADLVRRGVLAIPGFETGLPGDSEPPQAGEGGSASGRGALGSEFAVDVETLFHALRQKNFYELLGIPPDADRKQARAAYFTLSKKFHPDRAFGGDVADLRKKMEVIFRRLTQAYETISNPAQRAEYDSYIADQIAVWKMEQQLLQALKPAEPAAPPPVVPEPARPAPPVSVAPEPRPVEAPPRTATVSSKPPVPRPEHDSKRRNWQRERTQRMLQQTLGVGADRGSEPPKRKPRPQEVEDLLARGGIALEAGAHAEAVRLFGEALAEDPGNVRAAKLLSDAKAEATRALAAGYLRQGRYERLQGDTVRARASLTRAAELDPRNLEARHQLADLLLAERLDLRLALTLSREVIALGGQKARYFAILGELLLLAKEKDRAREAFSRAVQSEPDNKEYRKRLKACGG
jgi:curved DNA-binding protein CbpA/Tfp pilus assembly protein PilF